MHRPRMLAVVQLPPPVHGVTRMNEVVIRSALIRRDFELFVLGLRFADRISELGRVRVAKLFRALECGLRLLLQCVRNRPQIVYFTLVPTGAAFFRDLWFVWIMKALRMKRVFHLHGLGIPKSMNPLTRALYCWAFEGASIVHLSEEGRTEVAELIGRGSCLLLPNGVEDFGGDEWIGERRLREEPPRILFFSNMLESKGGLILLEALAQIASQGIEFQANFVGSECDPQWEACFSKLRAEAGLERQTKRLPECLGPAKQSLFRQADVFVFPSYYEYECFPLVLLEAMAAGLPAIATRHASIPEIVVEGETGFLVDPRSVDELSAAIARLLRDPDLRFQMGSAGRERYLAHYTTATFEAGLSRILRTAAGAPAANPGVKVPQPVTESEEPEAAMVSSP